jgi:hypothetical protein
MHGITYMHPAPLTVTDEQLQPLRSDQLHTALRSLEGDVRPSALGKIHTAFSSYKSLHCEDTPIEAAEGVATANSFRDRQLLLQR